MPSPFTVAIVEPHYDDAWLSLGGTILTHPEVRFRIVSVSRHAELNPHDRTKALGQRFEHVETVALELVDLGWRRRDVMRRARARSLPDARALFLAENRLEALEPPLDEACGDADVVALPMGLFHPMHAVVARAALERPTVTYFEYPYGFFPKCRGELAARTRGRAQAEVPVGEVAAEKRRVFEEVYPDQRYVLSLPQCPVRLEAMTVERLYAAQPAALSWLRPSPQVALP